MVRMQAKINILLLTVFHKKIQDFEIFHDIPHPVISTYVPKMNSIIILTNSLFTIWGPSGYIHFSNKVPNRVLARVLDIWHQGKLYAHAYYIQSNLFNSKSLRLSFISNYQ